MTDIKITAGPNGGEITLENAQIALDSGLGTAFYLSMFGGNVDDSGDSDSDAIEFWGNKIEDVPERKMRSKTQYLLQGTEASSANRLALEDAVLEDLQWSVSAGLVEEITVQVTIPAPKRAKIIINPIVNGNQSLLTFETPWGNV